MTSLAERLARPEIRNLPRFELSDRGCPAAVRLDANENPFPPLIDGPLAQDLNRYPDPRPESLRRRMAAIYGVAAERLLLTRGGDDAIDVLIRAFCRPGEDAVLVRPPTFGAYAHFARMNGVRVIERPLGPDFSFDAETAIAAVREDGAVKLVFLCTPNNPTGTVTPVADIRALAKALPDTLVLVDEAYLEFSESGSAAPLSEALPNLLVLRTLSKAYGLAGARVGALIGDPEVLEMAGRTLPPYPLPGPCIRAAELALAPSRQPVVEARISRLTTERRRLAERLTDSGLLTAVHEGGGNFLLLDTDTPEALAARLNASGIKVRPRPQVSPGALRLSVGTPEENDLVLAALGVGAPRPPGRRADISRDTRETRIAVAIDLDQAAPRRVRTGVGFYDHMLDQIAAHACISLILDCEGDLETDPHHTVEDCALALGAALKAALGDRRGIGRYGFVTPMDDAEAAVSLDLSARPFCRFEGQFATDRIGDYPTALTPHVFRSLADSLGAAIHVRVTGEDDHHKTEACFKAFGRALRQAIRLEGGDVPSTKGVL
ncbi:histidinol-phosphate transaminase [Brevundimonas sp. 2R-24]|uniref:Multifunctional fusion protein n=1 Tax=Peiella sedimenti TaxID=3061083 RepID=A0ABT8SJL2_9CAUL|nr:histidinol-phosphate transaminase [Caulobacteraceae bacterium XZ-24]